MERAVLYERERDFEIKDAEVLKERELYRQRVRLVLDINIPWYTFAKMRLLLLSPRVIMALFFVSSA